MNLLCLLWLCLWACIPTYAQQQQQERQQQEQQQDEEDDSSNTSINILLLSTSVDTRDAQTVDPNPFSSWIWYNDFSAPSSGAFVDGASIVREFLQIAQGTDMTSTINVEYQDIYSTALQDFETIQYTIDQVVHATNLFSWFHWPYPADVETTTRWPNLRGEHNNDSGTPYWDYIVLMEDRYTMEHMPGLYAQGVASIKEEVDKGTVPAKLVLFMNWPDPEKSTSTVEHYREIVHRVGQSAGGGGGLTVAPGAVAWQAAREPMDQEAQAYIVAATLFATLFDQSASTSSHGTETYHDYADIAYEKVIQERNNPPPFQPRYNSPITNPFKMLFDTRRDVGFTKKESSTESGYHDAAVRAVTRAGAQPHNTRGPAWFLQRASIYHLINRQYQMLYAFYYQNIDSRNDNHVSEIVDGDMSLADDMITFSEGLNRNPNPLRIVPRRILWALFHKVLPDASPRSSYPHVSQSASDLCGNYMYTLFSGRCPMGTSNAWEERIGYEAAWRIGNVQVRASGLQVLPSRIIQRSVSEKHPETIRIRFRIQPQANVTVNIAASVPEAVNITPSTQLTFTPSNYNTIQTIQVKGNMEQRGTSFDVIVSTQSEDVVYHQLEDRWEYEVNDYPELELSCCNDTVIVQDENTPGATCVKAATFDFDEDQLSIQWEMESGPGDVTFSNPTADMPTVTFSHPGTYVLKVSVSDGYTTVSDNSLMIEVRPDNTNYLPAMDETVNTFALGDIHYDRFRVRRSPGADSILDGPTYYSPFDYSGTTNEGFKLLNTTGNFGYRFRGYLDVPTSGYYSFYLESYRGCKMYIGSNREFVLDNQGWPVEEDSNTVGLEAGKHFIELGYFYARPHWGTPTPRVRVSWSGPGFAKQVFEAKDRLYRLVVEEGEAEVNRTSDTIGTTPDTKSRSTASPTQAEPSVAPIARGNAAGGSESDGGVEQKKDIGEYDLWT